MSLCFYGRSINFHIVSLKRYNELVDKMNADFEYKHLNSTFYYYKCSSSFIFSDERFLLSVTRHRGFQCNHFYCYSPKHFIHCLDFLRSDDFNEFEVGE